MVIINLYSSTFAPISIIDDVITSHVNPSNPHMIMKTFDGDLSLLVDYIKNNWDSISRYDEFNIYVKTHPNNISLNEEIFFSELIEKANVTDIFKIKIKRNFLKSENNIILNNIYLESLWNSEFFMQIEKPYNVEDLKKKQTEILKRFSTTDVNIIEIEKYEQNFLKMLDGIEIKLEYILDNIKRKKIIEDYIFNVSKLYQRIFLQRGIIG